MGDSPIEKTGQTPIYNKQSSLYNISNVNLKAFFDVKNI
jgi:hypothetical protein